MPYTCGVLFSPHTWLCCGSWSTMITLLILTNLVAVVDANVSLVFTAKPEIWATTTDFSDHIDNNGVEQQEENYFGQGNTSQDFKDGASQIEIWIPGAASLQRIVTNTVIGAIGVVDNFLVILVIMKSRRMRSKMANYPILNQSLIDLTGSIVLIGDPYLKDPAMISDPIAKAMFCKMWVHNWYMWGAFHASTLNLVAMAIERYMAVVHPMWHMHSCTKRRVVFVLVLVWLLGFTLVEAVEIAYRRVENGSCSRLAVLPSDLAAQIFGVHTYISQFFLPLIVVGWASIRMAYAVRASSLSSQHSMTSSNRTQTLIKAQRNIVKTLIIVYIFFIVCWTPQQTLYLLLNFYVPGIDGNSWWWYVTVVLAFINGCINPFIYVFKYEEFQTALKGMIFGLPVASHDFSRQKSLEVKHVSYSEQTVA